MAHHYKKYGAHHRRRNPFGLDVGEGTMLLWATAGGVAARAVPAMVLPSQNTGWIGYALNLGTAVLLKMLVGGKVGSDLFVGGGVATGLRIVSDNFGANIKGLSGDHAFSLGAYWQSYFAVPTVSDPYGRVSASPYPQPAMAAAGVKGGMAGPMARSAREAGRFGGRF